MSTKVIVVAGVLLLALGALGVWLRARRDSSGPGANEPPELDQFFIATSSESAARAASVLPAEGSEDQRALLFLPELPAEPETEAESTQDFLPDPRNDWSARVAGGTGSTMQRQKVLELLNPEWLRGHRSPIIYGRATENGRWTYLVAAGVPEDYSELLVAWKLIPNQPEGTPPTADMLRGYQRDLDQRLRPLGLQVVDVSAPPEAAAQRAHQLVTLQEQADREVIIRLLAPAGRPFEGQKIWDVMLSLGLEWGDMDLFHWNNTSSSRGGDQLFSVWSSTAPGYFLPEEIAAGRVRTEDLVFGFSIPRSPAPEQVFASMSRAARYAQHRLGGELVDASGAPLDDSAVLSEIKETVSLLHAHGFEPGEGHTLYIF